MMLPQCHGRQSQEPDRSFNASIVMVHAEAFVWAVEMVARRRKPHQHRWYPDLFLEQADNRHCPTVSKQHRRNAETSGASSQTRSDGRMMPVDNNGVGLGTNADDRA